VSSEITGRAGYKNLYNQNVVKYKIFLEIVVRNMIIFIINSAQKCASAQPTSEIFWTMNTLTGLDGVNLLKAY
jgi:hypothetical protein